MPWDYTICTFQLAPAGDGVVVFIFLDFIAQGGQLIFQQFGFPVDHVHRQGLAPAAEDSFAVNQHVAAVRPRVGVELAQVQQALVTLLVDALEAAFDFGQVIRWVVGALQNGVLRQMQRHVAVQPQAARAEHTRGQVHLLIRPAVVDGGLERGGVHGLPVAHGAVRRQGHVNGLFDSSCLRRRFSDQLSAQADLHVIACFGRQMLHCHMGAVDLRHRPAVQQHHINGVPRRVLGLFPPQAEAVVKRGKIDKSPHAFFSIPGGKSTAAVQNFVSIKRVFCGNRRPRPGSAEDRRASSYPGTAGRWAYR